MVFYPSRSTVHSFWPLLGFARVGACSEAIWPRVENPSIWPIHRKSSHMPHSPKPLPHSQAFRFCYFESPIVPQFFRFPISFSPSPRSAFTTLCLVFSDHHRSSESDPVDLHIVLAPLVHRFLIPSQFWLYRTPIPSKPDHQWPKFPPRHSIFHFQCAKFS